MSLLIENRQSLARVAPINNRPFKILDNKNENSASSFVMISDKMDRVLPNVAHNKLQFLNAESHHLQKEEIQRTIPFAWNLITAGYLEHSVFGLVLSIIGLLFSGKLLEPIWGSREFFKFIIVVNIFTSISVFITTIFLYYVTRKESFLYTPLYGFHGVLSGFLVGVKQIMPDQEMTVLFVLKLRAQWLPSLLVVVSIIVSILATESTTYLPFIIFGTYGSWLYLRYIQRKPETNLKGDPSDEFSFSTFFPEIMRPVVDAIALIFDKILCGRSQSSSEEEGQVAGGMPLPGSDPIEASRRRERGARALEERLAAAKAGEAVMVDENSRQDASESV